MNNLSYIKYSKEEILNNFWGLVEGTIKRYTNKEYIVAKHGNLTYGQAYQRANTIVKVLSDHFSSKQHGIGFFLKDPLKVAPIMIGTLKAGQYFVSLDVNFPETTLRSIIASAKIEAIFTDNENIKQAQSLIGANIVLINFDALDFSKDHFSAPTYNYHPDDWTQILFTSGSTGEPKGAIGNYRYFSHAISSKFDMYAYEVSDRVLSVSSFSFSGAYNLYFSALLIGLTICHHNIKDNGIAELSNWIREQRVTRFGATVTVFRAWASTLAPSEQFPLINSAHVGAEKRSPQDMEALKSIFPNLQFFRIGFASTETQSIASCVLPVNYNFGDTEVPCGKPSDGVKVLIWDEHGRELPNGEAGEIVVYSDSLVRGYINNQQLTNERFIPDPHNHTFQFYKTGDLGKIRDDGQLVHLGRIDNMVKIKGVRIELDSIEKHMNSYPGILQSAFNVFESHKGAKKLTAYFIAEEGIQVPVSDLRKFLGDRLPAHLLPHFFIQLDKFPMTRTGKLDKNQLPPPAMKRPPLSNPYVAPTTELESTLVHIWEEEIGVEGIGVTDDFFEVGGDSLIGVVLFLRIEQELNRSLPVSTLLSASTIQKQAKIINKEASPDDFATLITINPNGSNPPLFFIPGKGGYPTRIRHLAKLLNAETPIYALQDLLQPKKQKSIKRIETIATLYMNEILKVAPDGPYILIGESMGGKIALELAQQLKEHGKEVALLAMLDTYHFPKSRMLVEPLSYAMMLLKKHASILFYANWQGKRDYLVFYRETIKDKIQRIINNELNVLRGEKRSGILNRNKLVEKENISASDKYQPQPYPGRVIMFKAMRGHRTEEPANGWDKVELGELVIHPLDCYHGSILFEPAVSELAKVLNGYITQQNNQVDRS